MERNAQKQKIKLNDEARDHSNTNNISHTNIDRRTDNNLAKEKLIATNDKRDKDNVEEPYEVKKPKYK